MVAALRPGEIQASSLSIRSAKRRHCLLGNAVNKLRQISLSRSSSRTGIQDAQPEAMGTGQDRSLSIRVLRAFLASSVTQDQGAEPERRSEGVMRCPMSSRGLAPSRDLGSSPRPFKDLIGRLGGVPRLRGAVTVTGRCRRDPDIYRPADGEFRVSSSRDSGGETVGTGWDRTRAS